MVGEKRKDLILKTPKGPLLSLCHIYDSDGNELVQDKDRDVKYTVLLNRKNPLPQPKEDDDEVSNIVICGMFVYIFVYVFQSTLLPFIVKKEMPKQTIFTIDNPPKEGFFKLQIFARKKPTKKGRLKIPLVANFVVDFR